jgi:hypothetical protein
MIYSAEKKIYFIVNQINTSDLYRRVRYAVPRNGYHQGLVASLVDCHAIFDCRRCVDW